MNDQPEGDTPARPTDSHFRWNAGGWFGSLFGCTLWMPLAALAERDVPLVLATGLGGFVAGWVLGVWLWSRRARWSPFAALQLLLALLGLLSLALFAAADDAGRLETLANGWTRPFTPWVVLLVYPGVMALCAWLEWRARRAA